MSTSPKDPFTNLEIIEPNNTTTPSSNRKLVTRGTVFYILRLFQWISVIITIILSALSLENFYRSDERMKLICIFGVVSIFVNLILYILSTSNKFMNNKKTLIIFAVCGFEFLQLSIWLIGLGLISSKYPKYKCDRQGGTHRVDGCKCGQASIAFIALNFLLYLVGFIILVLNIGYRKELKNSKFKHHLLGFEDIV